MKTNESSVRFVGWRDGTTLVEIMVASVVLAILALGVGASITLTRSKTMLQRNHRTALELANGRLEDLRTASYNSVKPPALNYNTYYLAHTTSAWIVTASDPNERVAMNEELRPMRTTVQYVDVDGGGASYDCLKFTVRVQYYRNTNSLVTLETYKSP